MVRFQYVAEVTPPAPFVYATVRHAKRDLLSDEIPALLDSGADRSVIPGKLIGQLHLSPLREILVGGLGTNQYTLDTFSVILQIRHVQPFRVEVAAHPDESYILLGRDVLNQLRIVLDGPNQLLEIG